MTAAATASMTGSGVAAGQTALGELRIELRSVNGRGLSIKQRLCPEVSGLEAQIESEMRGHLHRGSVTLQIDRVGLAAAMPDRQALQQFVAELRDMAKDLSVSADLTLRDVLSLAQGGRSMMAPAGEMPDDVRALLQQALRQLVASRQAEGRVTVAAMQAHADELIKLRAEAVERAPAIVEAYRTKLAKRLEEYLTEHGVTLEARDLVREVGLFADRSDVSEELQRLEAHLAEVQSLLLAGGVLGRRLEFLLQEILRETNTLGSKSPDVAMSHCVVSMKSNIDKLKEQAANLE